MDDIVDLPAIFSTLKELLQRYQPPLVAKIDNDLRIDLVSIKDVLIADRKRREVYFASLIIQKGYVGFYFMPVYSAPEMKQVFHPELLGLLKGKSCFHIRHLNQSLLDQIQAALEAGFALYQQREWV